MTAGSSASDLQVYERVMRWTNINGLGIRGIDLPLPDGAKLPCHLLVSQSSCQSSLTPSDKGASNIRTSYIIELPYDLFCFTIE